MTSLTSVLSGPAEAVLHHVDAGEAPADIERRVVQAGWRFAIVECEGATDKAAVMEAFRLGLGLPEWFGRNLDALVDVLRDVGFASAGDPDADGTVSETTSATVVLWDRPDALRVAQPNLYDTIADILAERAGAEHPRIVALVRPAPELAN